MSSERKRRVPPRHDRKASFSQERVDQIGTMETMAAAPYEGADGAIRQPGPHVRRTAAELVR